MATDQVVPGNGAATVVNANFEAARAAMMYGRRASTTGTPTALTWGYYGGQFAPSVSIADGTVTLTNSATNYIVADRTTGVVSVATTTTNWLNSAGYIQLYEVVAAGGVVTGYTDRRPSVYNSTGGGGGSGTVTSVGLTIDATLADIFGVSGSPVTTSGSITVSADNLAADGIYGWDDSAGKAIAFTPTYGLSTNGSDLRGALQTLAIAASDLVTNITTGTGKAYFYVPYNFTVVEVQASLDTVQSAGSIFTVDINESGTSILSTKLTIDNGEGSSITAATPPVISDTSLAKGNKITIDVDQVGTPAAKGLIVYIIGYPT